jgi:hypothetical protein
MKNSVRKVLQQLYEMTRSKMSSTMICLVVAFLSLGTIVICSKFSSNIHTKSSRRTKVLPKKDNRKRCIKTKLEDPSKSRDLKHDDTSKAISISNELAALPKIDCGGVFDQMISTEIKRLLGLCEDWKKNVWSCQEEHKQHIKDDMEGELAVVVGKTNILIDRKIKQFRSLIEKYDTFDASGDKKDPYSPTYTDLQGFWELICIQVKDLDKSFAKLTELQSKISANKTLESEVKSQELLLLTQ